MVDSDHVIPRDSDYPTDRVSSPSGSRARLQHPPRVHVCLHVVTLIYIILSVNDAPYIVVSHARCVPVCIHVIYIIIIRKMLVCISKLVGLQFMVDLLLVSVVVPIGCVQ